MVKTKRKLAPRTPRNMIRANRRMNPSEKIRRPKARVPSERSRRSADYVKAYRNSLSTDQLYRSYAIATASTKWRCIIRSKGKPKKTGTVGRPSKHAFRPDNYEELLALIPECHRVKPTAIGQCAIYVPHDPSHCDSWTNAKVAGISRHKETNWILFEKPCVEYANPYVLLRTSSSLYVTSSDSPFRTQSGLIPISVVPSTSGVALDRLQGESSVRRGVLVCMCGEFSIGTSASLHV